MVNPDFNNFVSNRFSINLTKAITAAINTFDYFQYPNSHWQKQYLIPSGWKVDHYKISNFTEDDIPTKTKLIEFETNSVSSEVISTPNTHNEINTYLNYVIPIVMILPIVYIIKRPK